jgi:hypothetical protein
MSKSQNRGIRNVKRQRNMVSQGANNHTTKDLVNSEGEEISISKLKRIMSRMINEGDSKMAARGRKQKASLL